MSESTITLSFAELGFLLSLVGEDTAVVPRGRLGVPALDSDDRLAQSGLSSLALRDLARSADGGVVLAPEVGAVLAGLCNATTAATVAVRSDDSADVVQFFLGDRQSLAVSQRAFACFQFDGLDDDAKVCDVVTSLALAGGDRVVAVSVDDRSFEVAVSADRALAVVDGAESNLDLTSLGSFVAAQLDGR
jgi:hypothetical protein